MYICNFGVTYISYDSHTHVGAYKKYKDRDDITRESNSLYSTYIGSKVSTCMSLH